MSLILQPPCLTALGLRWCEDFRRGPVGVAKNRGSIHGTVPNIVDLEGRWAKFPGLDSAYIEYPYVVQTPSDSITVSILLRNVVTTGTDQLIIGKADGAGFPANVEWFMYLNVGNNWLSFGCNINAGWRAADYNSFTGWNETFRLTGTWKSGDNVRLYLNENQISQSSSTHTGTMNKVDNPLILGRRVDAGTPFKGEMADPSIYNRALSQPEIEELINQSLFH